MKLELATTPPMTINSDDIPESVYREALILGMTQLVAEKKVTAEKLVFYELSYPGFDMKKAD